MARPREFDEGAALDAAVQCFWARGYEATSVRDLADGMKINGASLYNAFGDKRALYRRALDHYLDHTVRDRIVRLEGSLPPRDAIRVYFEEIVERSLDDRKGRGCLLVNSALEVAPHDLAMRRAVVAELAQIEAFFLRCIRAVSFDQEDEDEATDLARLLLSVLLGIRVLARTRPSRAQLEGALRPVITLLDARSTKQRRIAKRAIRPSNRLR